MDKLRLSPYTLSFNIGSRRTMEYAYAKKGVAIFNMLPGEIASLYNQNDEFGALVIEVLHELKHPLYLIARTNHVELAQWMETIRHYKFLAVRGYMGNYNSVETFEGTLVGNMGIISTWEGDDLESGLYRILESVDENDTLIERDNLTETMMEEMSKVLKERIISEVSVVRDESISSELKRLHKTYMELTMDGKDNIPGFVYGVHQNPYSPISPYQTKPYGVPPGHPSYPMFNQPGWNPPFPAYPSQQAINPQGFGTQHQETLKEYQTRRRQESSYFPQARRAQEEDNTKDLPTYMVMYSIENTPYMIRLRAKDTRHAISQCLEAHPEAEIGNVINLWEAPTPPLVTI